MSVIVLISPPFKMGRRGQLDSFSRARTNPSKSAAFRPISPRIDDNCSNWIPVNTNKQIWLIIIVNKILIIVDNYS